MKACFIKIKSMGISGELYNLFENYLSGSLQRVILNGNTKCFGVKAALSSETCMYISRLDSWPFTSFVTLLICLQCSDDNSGEDDGLGLFKMCHKK